MLKYIKPKEETASKTLFSALIFPFRFTHLHTQSDNDYIEPEGKNNEEP